MKSIRDEYDSNIQDQMFNEIKSPMEQRVTKDSLLQNQRCIYEKTFNMHDVQIYQIQNREKRNLKNHEEARLKREFEENIQNHNAYSSQVSNRGSSNIRTTDCAKSARFYKEKMQNQERICKMWGDLNKEKEEEKKKDLRDLLIMKRSKMQIAKIQKRQRDEQILTSIITHYNI